MHKIKKAVFKVFLVIFISCSIILSTGVIPTVAVEAAAKVPAVKENKKTLFIGFETYKVQYSNLTKSAKVSYTSKNKNVATVSKTGIITPKAVGNTTIAITVKQNNKTYNLTVAVTVLEPYIEFIASTTYLNVGEEFLFKTKAYGMKDKATLSVSDPSLANLNAGGKITALAAGRVTVIAKAGSSTAECEVIIGSNRLGTYSKNITVYNDRTIWINVEDCFKDETLSCSNADPKVLDCTIRPWEGDRAGLSLDVKGIGQDTLTITTNKSDDRLIINVTVVDVPKDQKKLSASEVYTKCGPLTVEINAENDYSTSLGSGFFVNDNMVVTNYHVIQGAKKIQVTTKDNVKYDVTTIIGYDELLDLAILKVNADMDGLALSQSRAATGETIYTLGSPLGLTGSLSNGMISTGSRIIDNVDYIQINAAISSGNSGGPLVNEYGEVIGVNTMYYENGQNLNFAININELQKVNTNRPISVAECYEEYNAKLEEEFEANMIYEDTEKSQDVDTCQFIPPFVGVEGTLVVSEKWDIYYFTVTEPCWFIGLFKSDSTNDMKNTYIELYDEEIEWIATAQEREGENFQYIKVYLNPGDYLICITKENTYTGADMPYFFYLLYY